MQYTIVCKESAVSQQLAQYIKNNLPGYNENNPEIVICVGGDGTVLRAMHQYLEKIDTLKFVGIHTGNLGFLTDYTKEEVDILIEHIQSKKYEIYKSNLLDIAIEYEDEILHYHALNEMRIESIIYTQKLDIHIDDEYFETIVGSGLCISTQAGSTAMNRALNGAVVDDGIQLLQLSEITGIHHKYSHSLRNPYIMKCSRNIKITSESFKEAYVCFDHKNIKMENVKSVRCTTSHKQIQFIRFRKYSYLKRLKNLY